MEAVYVCGKWKNLRAESQLIWLSNHISSQKHIHWQSWLMVAIEKAIWLVMMSLSPVTCVDAYKLIFIIRLPLDLPRITSADAEIPRNSQSLRHKLYVYYV
jgi:hypothetical protein